jgi:hypothetical protein
MAKEAIHNMDTLKSENGISQLGHIARDSLFTDEKNPPEQPLAVCQPCPIILGLPPYPGTRSRILYRPIDCNY